MLTAIVQVQFASDATLESATAAFEASAPGYLGRDGLLRKHYLFDPQTRIGGGCYLMADRASADRLFDDGWRRQVETQFGAAPDVVFFETPVVVDNQLGRIQQGGAVE